jgi:hypothetical protein
MLETHVRVAPKSVARLRRAVGRECTRANADPDYAEVVNSVLDDVLRVMPLRSSVFVIVNVLSDATFLIIRGNGLRAWPDHLTAGSHVITRWSGTGTLSIEIPRPESRRPGQPNNTLAARTVRHERRSRQAGVQVS